MAAIIRRSAECRTPAQQTRSHGCRLILQNTRLLTILVACGLIAPAAADEVTAVTLAKTARLSGDAIIADACHLRPSSWLAISVPAIMAELNRQARDLSPSGGVDPGDMPASLYASINQAVDEGTVQFDRYHQAACQAIQDDGSLARIDALVAGFKPPKR